MDYLIRGDGSEIKDETLVVAEVQQHYEELNSPPMRQMTEHPEMQVARKILGAHTHFAPTTADNTLVEIPLFLTT